MSAQNIYLEIINRVKRIYETYEDRANQLAEDKRKKVGGKTQKSEDQFLRDTNALQVFMTETIDLMKSEKNPPNQLGQNIKQVQACCQDIRALLKKKSLTFKVTPEIRRIVEDTKMCLDGLRKSLKTVKQTKFLCCGTDGVKLFKTPMNMFRTVAAKWRMLGVFEPKDGVETFINPKFQETDYQFISDILRKMWPQKEVIEVQVVKEVVREIPVSTGKASPLGKANQSIYGINREQNITQGLETYYFQAQRGNPEACCFLGKLYEEGVLLQKDLKQASAYYKQAMKGKDSYAQYRYALCLIKGKFSKEGQNKKQIQEGYNLLNQIANDQNPSAEALTELGQVHEFGHFQADPEKIFTVKQDTSKAILLYKKARKYKLPRATNNLAVLYLNMKLSEKDGKSEVTSNIESDSNILAYLEQAKEAGFSQAYYNLGMIFSKGLLSQKDPQLAMKMFYEGSIKGDYKCKIKFAYELMNQTSIMKQQYDDHYNLAIQWLQNVVRKFSRLELYDNNNSQASREQKGEALFYLGLFHQHGFGVQKSAKKSINYFIQSAGMDYSGAKNKLGDCYFSGYGVKQDRQLAVGQYMQSAEDGNSDAMVNLGSVYLNGVSGLLEKNYKKAHDYFLLAHDYGNSDALIHLSYMYRNGLQVEQNQDLARDLLEQAAQAKNATALYMLKEQGIQFDEGVLFEHLQNQFFSAPKKLNIKEQVPVLNTQYRSKIG